MFNRNVLKANAMVVQVPDPLGQLKSVFGVWTRIVRPSDAHELAATSSAEPSSVAPAPAANLSHTAEAAVSTGLDADTMADEASQAAANDAKMQPALTDKSAGDGPTAASNPVCTGLDGKGSHRQRHMCRPRKSFPLAADELAVMEPAVQPAPAQRMTRAAAKQAEVQTRHVLRSGSPAPDEPVVTKPVVQPARARAAAKQAEVQARHVLRSGPLAAGQPVVIESAVQPAPAQRMTRAAAKQAEVQAGHVLRSGKVSASRPAATLPLPSGRGAAPPTTRAARAAATAQQADMPSQSASATTAAQQGHDGTVRQGTLAPALLASGVRGRPSRLAKSAAVPAAQEAMTSGTPIAKCRPGRPAKSAAVPSPNKPEAAGVAGDESAVLSRPGRGRQVTAVPAHADPEAADATPAAKPKAATAELQGTNAEPNFPAIEPINAGPGSAGARPGAATLELEATTADPAAAIAEPEAAASSQAAAQHAHLKQPASAPCTRAQSRACVAREAVQPVRHCCSNRRCKACRAKAEADKQSPAAAPAATPCSLSEAIPDDNAAATIRAADSNQQAQLEAATIPQQPPKSGRNATPTAADPAASSRSVHAASRANARTEGTTPGASDRPRSTTRKRHREEESETEQLPIRPMPARIQQRRAPSGHASQQADKQVAAVAEPAGPVPIELLTGSASPAELSSDRASLAAQSSDRLSPAGVSSDEPAAAVPQAELLASPQGPEQLPAAQAHEAAAAAPDRRYCSAKAQGLVQFAAATRVADADADAAAVSHDIALPDDTPARRSARSRKATEKAAGADGSFAAMAKGTKLPLDTAHQAPCQQDRPAACSPAGRGTKRAADFDVSAPSAPAVLTMSKSLARKKRRQSAGPAGADHVHRKTVSDDDDVEIFTVVHTKPETAMHLGGSIDKVSRGVRKTPGGRGRGALPHQSQMASVHSLDMLIAAVAEVEAKLAPEAEVCR